jgi:hypothetical protein
MTSTLKHAIGIISSREAATQALDELRVTGFPMSKISIITKNSEFNQSPSTANVEKRTITPVEGAKAGAITGGTTGGILTLIAGLGVLIIPGFGPVLAVESLLATLLASGATATLGGLVGALQGWFVPEEQAQLYNESVSQGEYLVTIEATEGEIQQAEPVLQRWGVREWHIYSEA